jgi:hypothetical protein
VQLYDGMWLCSGGLHYDGMWRCSECSMACGECFEYLDSKHKYFLFLYSSNLRVVGFTKGKRATPESLPDEGCLF